MNQAILDTLYMTLISMVLVTIIGLVLGLILTLLDAKQTVCSNHLWNRIDHQ